MRAGIPGVVSPHPIGLALPALYVEDDFVQRFVAGLDEVLAPVLLTLDCLDAYLDPALAPDDFLDWLAGWVAAPMDDGWPASLRRQAVREAARLHRWRGTTRGVVAELRLLSGGEVELVDSGGVTWSTTPTADVAAAGGPARVLVRIHVTDAARMDQRRLTEVVAQAVPAHVRTAVEVVAEP